MKTATISGVFLAAAIYDGLLGLAFLVAADWIFQFSQVTPPNHMGYVQFPGALLMIFAIMFAVIARRPRKSGIDPLRHPLEGCLLRCGGLPLACQRNTRHVEAARSDRPGFHDVVPDRVSIAGNA